MYIIKKWPVTCQCGGYDSCHKGGKQVGNFCMPMRQLLLSVLPACTRGRSCAERVPGFSIPVDVHGGSKSAKILDHTLSSTSPDYLCYLSVLCDPFPVMSAGHTYLLDYCSYTEISGAHILLRRLTYAHAMCYLDTFPSVAWVCRG